MPRRRWWLLPEIGILLALILGISTNYATAAIPAVLRANVWATWTILGGCVLLLVVRERLVRRENRLDDVSDVPVYRHEAWGPGVVRSFADHPSRAGHLSKFRRSLELIDSLPVNEGFYIRSVSYGEGPHATEVQEDRLYRLPAAKRLLSTDTQRVLRPVEPRNLLSQEDIDCLKKAQHLKHRPRAAVAFPHEFAVHGIRGQTKSDVAVYLVTDIPYLQGVNREDRPDFSLPCLLGRGGIASFVDISESGDVSMPEELGPVALLVGVEYVKGVPIGRTRYILVVRFGILYPSDIWILPETGQPLISRPAGGSSSELRFAFQSRQPNALSSDIFVADLDGERLADITYKGLDAYDGFAQVNGQPTARWLDEQRLQHSAVRGGRFQTVVSIDPVREAASPPNEAARP
jgi:hypothetical protein